jgi:hypothetical protein
VTGRRFGARLQVTACGLLLGSVALSPESILAGDGDHRHVRRERRRWDHVAPPKGDRWGPGTRVPAIIVSPLAKPRYIDHTVYDTTSILKTIEIRWNLQPLGTRDAAANDLGNAFR